MNYSEGFFRTSRKVVSFANTHRYHCVASILIFFWILPYFTTGTKVVLGDFTFFAQAYEALRISILHYHQFPWYNPWVSGGVPLYANPQMGVFSLQTVLVLLFGAIRGLKYAVAIYIVLGYASMYFFLTRYFKIDRLVGTLLSLIWIFCSFYVAHLPAHFTFVWFMLSPFYFYLSLTVKDWRGGLKLGLVFAIMGLSQIHDSFFLIACICAVIVLVRLILEQKARMELLKCIGIAALVFLLLAGHRLLYTYQNVHDFSMNVSDPPAALSAALLGPILPLSMTHPFKFLRYPGPPITPYGFGEVTATIGIFALIAALVSLSYVVYRLYRERKAGIKNMRCEIVIIGVTLVFAALAVGKFNRYTPYNVLKHLPIFSQMRVSTRYWIFFDAGLIALIGLVARSIQKKSFLRLFVVGLLTLGVIELFFTNVGYQGNLFASHVDVPKNGSWNYQFAQTSYFGQTRKLPGGGTIPKEGKMPSLYREFEATSWNLGILYANDSLVQLPLDPRHVAGGHPTCPWEEGCNYVLSDNAKVIYWSPNKVTLQRTGPGPIKMNMNNSNYFVIDGVRQHTPMVVMPFTDFIIPAPDSQKTVTITAHPSLLIPVKDVFHKHPRVTLMGQPR